MKEKARSKKTSAKHDAKLADLEKVLGLKRDGISKTKLSGPAKLRFTTAAQFGELAEDKQAEFLDRSAVMSETILKLVAGIVANREPTGADDVLAAVISEVGRNSELPLRRRYVEMSLWRRLLTFSEKSRRSVREVASQERSGGEELADGTGTADMSFRDYYIGEITSNFAESLDVVRESESMSRDRVQFFARCLEAGIDIFSDVQKDLCLSKSRTRGSR